MPAPVSLTFLKSCAKSPFPTKKAMQQAGSYTFTELIDLMDRLVVADNAMKTGADPDRDRSVDRRIDPKSAKPKFAG